MRTQEPITASRKVKMVVTRRPRDDVWVPHTTGVKEGLRTGGTRGKGKEERRSHGCMKMDRMYRGGTGGVD